MSLIGVLGHGPLKNFRSQFYLLLALICLLGWLSCAEALSLDDLLVEKTSFVTFVPPLSTVGSAISGPSGISIVVSGAGFFGGPVLEETTPFVAVSDSLPLGASRGAGDVPLSATATFDSSVKLNGGNPPCFDACAAVTLFPVVGWGNSLRGSQLFADSPAGRYNISSVPEGPAVNGSFEPGSTSLQIKRVDGIPQLALPVADATRLPLLAPISDSRPWTLTMPVTIGEPFTAGMGISNAFSASASLSLPQITSSDSKVKVIPALTPSELLFSPSGNSSAPNANVRTTISGNSIAVTVQPNFGLTPTEAAQALGFDHFNWIQTITRLGQPCDPGQRNMSGSLPPPSPPRAFVDPPKGGYFYQYAVQQHDAGNPLFAAFPQRVPFAPPYVNATAPFFPAINDSYPMYWDELFTGNYKVPNPAAQRLIDQVPEWRLHSTTTNLVFSDQPSSEGAVDFRTRLVGVRADHTWAFIDVLGASFVWEYLPPPCAQDAPNGCLTNFEFLKNDGTLPTIGGNINFLGFLPVGQFSDEELQLILQDGGGILSDQAEVVTPEPTSLLLFGSSFTLLSGWRWVQRRRGQTTSRTS